MEKLSEFLKQFNISQSDFDSTGLNWQELLVLKADYEKFMQELKAPANYLVAP